MLLEQDGHRHRYHHLDDHRPNNRITSESRPTPTRRSRGTQAAPRMPFPGAATMFARRVPSYVFNPAMSAPISPERRGERAAAGRRRPLVLFNSEARVSRVSKQSIDWPTPSGWHGEDAAPPSRSDASPSCWSHRVAPPREVSLPPATAAPLRALCVATMVGQDVQRR